MGTIKTTNIETITGSGTLTLGQSGETINIPSGCTINNNGTQTGFGGVMTPMFLATKANTGFTAGVYSKIGFATEVFDTDNCYDNSTNYRFTPTTAGKYYIFARVAFDNDSASSRQIARILKNGTEVARGDQQLSGSYFANNNTSAQVDYIVDLNGSSDYVEVQGYTEQNGATKNTAGYGCFGGYRIIGA